MKKLLVFPRDQNPYQEMLYSEFKDFHIRYLEGPTKSQSINLLLYPIYLILLRIRGYKIFHLHWVYGFSIPGRNGLQTFLSTIYYFFILSWIKILNYKLVWTIHNTLPHHKLFLNDLLARKFLAKLSDLKILHTKSVYHDLDRHGIDSARSVVIQIGSFVGYYKDTISKEEAKKVLGIEKNKFVFLFFGRIEKYKGVLELIEAFKRVERKDVLLIIAGTGNDRNLQGQIQKESEKNIQFINKTILDNDIQLYFKSADVAVFPFRRITTSSSILLSLSFGVPAIYRNQGCLSELPLDVGFGYKMNDELTGLLNTVVSRKSDLKDMGDKGFAYAKSLSWKNIAQKTESEFTKLLNRTVPKRVN